MNASVRAIGNTPAKAKTKVRVRSELSSMRGTR
jgi:hypothetical protein